ncbi:carbonic anhydrase [Halobacterium rubrum]|uniref:carbonic anhydrase n=1 Tax=Halobacterium TaxID=2239 RepID=UPI001F35A4F4|nr:MULTISPECIES: carbonic anhydrase [Halobacterium]MDH5020410.1 carbonic anhydrase [Halobacterium rubrum]
MPAASLRELLERNDRHVASLADDHFAAVQDGQSPSAVSVCCSDSRVPQADMFDVEEPGWLFSPSTIGNQVWDRVDGERVVDGSVLYPVEYAGTDTAVVVGHTGCGAVTAALEAVQQRDSDGEAESGDAHPAGVAKWVAELVPVVEAGLADDRVREARDASLVDQLVEFNVDRQVAFLRESEDVPADVDVYGFVYDFHGVYGDDHGRAYLVNANGETDVGALREQAPDEFGESVQRLL